MTASGALVNLSNAETVRIDQPVSGDDNRYRIVASLPSVGDVTLAYCATYERGVEGIRKLRDALSGHGQDIVDFSSAS